MDTQKYIMQPIQAQEDRIMHCRVWNENLAAFFVAEPLAIVPDTHVETLAVCGRESDGPTW